jgi:hypothetical protein
MKKLGFTTGVFALALLTGCATVENAPKGDYALGGYTVTLGQDWSDISNVMTARSPHVKLLSVDGPLLNRLYLTDGLGYGDYMVKPVAKERPTPTYRKGMSPNELLEFVADSVSALDYQRVETHNLRPTALAGSPALRFDITAKTRDGLDISGSAETAEIDGKLYVMLYLAPSEHFYDASLPEVEHVFASARKAGVTVPGKA